MKDTIKTNLQMAALSLGGIVTTVPLLANMTRSLIYDGTVDPHGLFGKAVIEINNHVHPGWTWVGVAAVGLTAHVLEMRSRVRRNSQLSSLSNC